MYHVQYYVGVQRVFDENMGIQKLMQSIPRDCISLQNLRIPLGLLAKPSPCIP